MKLRGAAKIVLVMFAVVGILFVQAGAVCAGWTNPADINDNLSPDGGEVSSTHVAMDDSDNAIVVWSQDDGAKYQIFKSEYRSGAWTNPSGLSDNISVNGQGAYYPFVAMDNNGNAIVVWYQDDGANDQIFKAEYRSGAWTFPSSLSDNISPDGQTAQVPQVAMDDNGNAIIVWRENDGADYQIFKSEYRNGAWSNPIGVSDNISPDGQEAQEPSVAMSNNGEAVIVWFQNDGANNQIFKSEYRNGAWSNPTGLSDNISPDGQTATSPEVAMDSDGNTIITWHQNDGANNQIFKSEYRNGAWTNPSGLSDNISPDGQDAVNPEVGMNDNGQAIIVWSQTDGASSQIYKSEYRNSAWTNPTGLADNISPGGTSAYGPQVGMDDYNNAFVVWYQFNGANDMIYASLYQNGVWDHPDDVNDFLSPTGQDAEDCFIAVNGKDNAVMVWEQDDGSDYQTFVSQYLSYLLTVSTPGPGSGTVSGSQGWISIPDGFSAYPFQPGESTTLTTTPDSGSYFWGWSGGACSGKGDCPVTLNADTTVTAEFALAAPLMGGIGVALLALGLLGVGIWRRRQDRAPRI